MQNVSDSSFQRFQSSSEFMIFENSCVERGEEEREKERERKRNSPGVTIVYGDLERKLHPSQVVESVREEAWQTSVEDEAINYEIQLRSRAHGRYTSRLRRYFK